MTEERSAGRPYAFGVTLIIIGVLFFLDNIGVFEFSWPLILVVIGAALLLEAWFGRRASAVFSGSFLLMLGLIFLGNQLFWFSHGMSNNWPLILVALGASFFFLYLARPSKAGVLIPGGILIGLGILFLFAQYRYIRWYRVVDVLDWWPILLIGVGLWLLLRKR